MMMTGAGPRANGGAFGPGSPGFLSTCSSVFAITNLLLQSKALATTPWTPNGANGAAAPTLTNNAALAPDATMTATQLTLPAVSGTGRSFVYQSPAGATPNYILTNSVWVRGATGTEHIWLTTTDNTSALARISVAATTSWVQYSGQVTLNNAGGPYIEIGVDLTDGSQSAQPPQTVYVWQPQTVYGDTVRADIPTTTAQVTANQTIPCPAGVAFRDFSALTYYAGNPIMPQNTGTYNAGGVSGPYFSSPANKIGTDLYALANCTVSGANRGKWPNHCVYKAPVSNPLAWADQSGSNPAITTTPGGWDDHFSLHAAISNSCSVDTYCAYYGAHDASNNLSIGMAHSSNLLTYTKYGTTSLINNSMAGLPTGLNNFSVPTWYKIGAVSHIIAAYSGDAGGLSLSNFTSPAADGLTWTYNGLPVVSASSNDWYGSGGLLADPHIFLNKHGFYELYYTSFVAGVQKIAYAVSLDGVHFWPYQVGPIITQSSTAYPGTFAVGDAVAYEDATTYYIFYNYDDAVSLSAGVVSTVPDH